jgi:hypothetical protein
MQGDVRSYFQELTNAPARVTWDVTALEAATRALFNVWYDEKYDYTYLGIQGRPEMGLLITGCLDNAQPFERR